MIVKNLIEYYSGLSVTVKHVKKFQKSYESELAFRFNSFNFVNPDENKYSKILAYFLEPRQTHGQGEVFLNLFLQSVELTDKATAADFVKIKCEHSTDDRRRIDILITFKNKFVLGIENKVWAKDQKEQLKDYNSYLQKLSPNNYCLLYITPYQNDPSELSVGDLKLFKDLEMNGLYKSIGYTDYIIDCVHNWAINCRAERVRCFLLDFEQYLKNEFLGETFMEETHIIADYALNNKENLEVAFATAHSIDTIKEILLNKLGLQIKEIANSNNLIMGYPYNFVLNQNYSKFSLKKKNWKYGSICFQFDSKYANNFRVGIVYQGIGDEPIQIPEGLGNQILKRFGKTKSKENWWLFFDHFEGVYKNWGNQSQPWLDIQSGQMKDRIDEKVKEYINEIGDLKL